MTSKLRNTAVWVVLATAFAPIAAFAAEAGSPGEQVALLEAIDQHEIDAAKAAEARNVPQAVKDFAKMMETDHQKNLDETKAAAEQASVMPDETDAVKNFKKEHDAKLDSMKALDDAQFAKQYSQAMVDGHQQALEKLDGFIASAQGPLKDHFTKTRDTVAMHLQKAQDLAKSL